LTIPDFQRAQRENCDDRHSPLRAMSSKPACPAEISPDRLGPEPEESAVTTLTKLCGPLAILATLAVATAPAHAQFEGAGDQMAQFAPMMEQFAPMMEQFAPMMQRMTSKIGKKRIGHMMQAVAPMMLSMMAPGGSMPGMESITGMMGEGPTRRAGRRHR
jgi:hypothetical protein